MQKEVDVAEVVSAASSSTKEPSDSAQEDLMSAGLRRLWA